MFKAYLFLLLFLYPLLFVNSYAETFIRKQNDIFIPQVLEDSFRSELFLLGQAKLSVLFWNIYNSKLYASSDNFDVKNIEQVTLFEINYLRDISKKDLIDKTIEQWSHIGVTSSTFGDYLPLLNQLWPNISKGDSLSLLVRKYQSTFYLNNQLLGTISDKGFGKNFLDIWLSEKTSQPKLRQQLLRNTLPINKSLGE